MSHFLTSAPCGQCMQPERSEQQQDGGKLIRTFKHHAMCRMIWHNRHHGHTTGVLCSKASSASACSNNPDPLAGVLPPPALACPALPLTSGAFHSTGFAPTSCQLVDSTVPLLSTKLFIIARRVSSSPYSRMGRVV